MKQCLACQSDNVTKAKNDSGFYKDGKSKPVRLYQWACGDCGFVATFMDKKETVQQ
ncbi:hypothetical protein DFQ01_14426 [Paenibacillus cellulosilyticus]|uniref:Uncharacterized protein n=1 Tax=Paenibacillus cellulosilyticus TaxID=375489 RepID=A0A2V2YE48_9BACL|nr:hypothetical protein [Paenibacillus cellulosilyticus]PWV90250.1 hypothetical protein DFQ01_14426 [Paenibacillus cellulosilyticus]QKS43408.1 hypothetical protein HUB94_02485 [Paenibacillus cellulosilyticus]